MQIFINHLLKFLFYSIITFWTLKNSLPLLKKYFPAKATQRSLHKDVKPSSGGISFIMIYNIFSLFQGIYLPIFSLPIALIGILDDKYNISKTIRYVCQIITILFFTFFLKTNSNLFISKLIEINIIYIIILLFFGSLIINIINFMDGIDGLVSGSMIVIFTTINISSEFYLIPIIGCLFGFICLNWYPSKVFMGDSGSLFLGSYLTSIIFSSNSLIDIIKILFLCSPLLLDSLLCIIRRLFNGQNIFKSHKLHLYQRLVSNGFKHSDVSLIYIISIVFLSIFYLHSNLFYFSIAVLATTITGIYLDKKYAINFN
tara:strand:- start:245 stop:1189 length:945 start_codon:yes stop_codon:yes gene_type:complete